MKNRDHTANDVRIFQSAHPALQMAFTDVRQTGEKENHREQQKTMLKMRSGICTQSAPCAPVLVNY